VDSKAQEVLDRLMGRKRCDWCQKKLPDDSPTNYGRLLCPECSWREENNPGANEILFGGK